MSDRRAGSRPGGTEALAALLYFLSRLCLGAGVVGLALASYAWWGNPATPLGRLAIPCACLVVAGWVLAFVHRATVRRHLAALKKSRGERIPPPSKDSP